MARHREEGASALMIAVALVLLALALLASRVLSRLGDSADDKKNTVASLQRAQTALDQFFAAGGASARLPCPADPTRDTGLEDPTPATGNCNSPTGSIPWATIGLRRDDGYDAWGRKISYRVYTGNKGSLVQVVAGGVSMINCYDDGTNTAGSGTSAAGLCATDHSTSKFDFLSNGKGLKLTDYGVDHTPNNNDPTAYVLISHGPTGLGGYSASGVKVLTENKGPGGDELDNTKDTGPFHVEAWSDPDVGATSNSHFDDLVVYRTVADLAIKSNLVPRNWPTSTLTFNAATVGAAFGSTVSSGSMSSGTGSVDFGNMSAQGLFGSSRINLVFDVDSATGLGGLGVGLPLFGNGISSNLGESITFDYSPATPRILAITLIGFSTFTSGSTLYTEQVQFNFSNGHTSVGTVQKGACGGSPGLETFVVTAPSNFTSVQVVPLSATSSGSATSTTSFTIAAVTVCRSGSTTCSTGIAGATACP